MNFEDPAGSTYDFEQKTILLQMANLCCSNRLKTQKWHIYLMTRVTVMRLLTHTVMYVFPHEEQLCLRDTHRLDFLPF